MVEKKKSELSPVLITNKEELPQVLITNKEDLLQEEVLISFSIDNTFQTNLKIDGLIIGSILLVLLGIFVVRATKYFWFQSFEIDEAELGLGSAKIKLKPNNIDRQIAYKIWVELSTRKIGLEIDLNNDVISEIYDSWYEFFKVSRELIKEVPVSKFRRQDTERIIQLSIDVLNNGVRPHLTLWQAKFKRWYKRELENPVNDDLSPQDIQMKFNEYNELILNLKDVNHNLMRYRAAMHNLITSNK